MQYLKNESGWSLQNSSTIFFTKSNRNIWKWAIYQQQQLCKNCSLSCVLYLNAFLSINLVYIWGILQVDECLLKKQNATAALAEKALHQMVVCGYALIGHDPAQAMRNVIELKNMINTGLKPVSVSKDIQSHSDATVNENKLDYDPNAAYRRDIFSSKSPMLLKVSNSLMSKTFFFIIFIFTKGWNFFRCITFIKICVITYHIIFNTIYVIINLINIYSIVHCITFVQTCYSTRQITVDKIWDVTCVVYLRAD